MITTSKSYRRYKFLFDNSPIPIHETNISNVTKAIQELKAKGITNIEDYVSKHGTFFSEIYYSSDIFDVNDAMLRMTEADSKAYYLKNFKFILGEPCFDFFKGIFIALFNGQNQLTGKTQIRTFKGRKIWVEATAIFLSMDGEEIINYTFKEITEEKLKDDAIQLINDRLVTGSFQEHLNNLVLALSEAFQLSHVFIGVLSSDNTKVRSLAFSANNELHENITYNLLKAPCLNIYQKGEKVVYTNYLDEIYPNNNAIQVWKGKSYMGYPLRNKKGQVIGHFAFINDKPIQNIEALQDVMELYVSWASTELVHIQNQQKLKEKTATIENQLNDLNQKNQELERYLESNMQLENFAYIASHDLQAPIRTIISFSQLLQRNLKGKLDTNGQEFLDFIISASRNMKALIEDLLLFSRIDNQQLNVQNLVVENILLAISSEIQTTIQEKDAIIKWENVTQEIQGDIIKLKQLFQNLITNAIKFQRPNIQPIVIITGEDKGTHWQFSVQDNGIGIDGAYFDRIFSLFQKIHGKEEFEGTGLGLAICKKIVEQHQGEIWLTSETNQGTTFYFTIAK
ncbi:MAG: ATP-binding protein [Saprospiraceae bacterium]